MKDMFVHAQEIAVCANNKSLYIHSDEINEWELDIIFIIHLCISNKNTRKFTSTI